MGCKEADMIEMFPSFSTISQCIHVLCERIKDTEYFGINYDSQVNLPKPAEMVAKFLVHVTQCEADSREPTIHIIKAMLNIAPLMTTNTSDTTVPDLWAGTIPQLLDYIKTENFDLNKWEDVNHRLLTNTITCKKDEKWTCDVGDAFIIQLGTYVDPSRVDFKRVALSMTGAVVSKSNKKDFVIKGIESIIDATDHTINKQRQGCAKALGFISSTHTDAVLDRLSRLTRPVGKPTGVFAKKDGKLQIDMAKATTQLAYGHCTQKTPQQLMVSRLDPQIIPNVIMLLNEAKLQEVKEAGMQGVDMMAKALRKVPDGFQFKAKEQVIDGILIVANPMLAVKGLPNRDAFVIITGALHALTTIMYILPKLSGDMMDKLMKFTLVLLQREWDLKEKEDKKEKEKSKKDDTDVGSGFELPDDEDHRLFHYELGSMLGAILEESLSEERLVQLLQVVGDRMQSDSSHERQRSIAAYVALLNRYAALKPADSCTAPERQLECMGRIIGQLVPRLSDTNLSVRKDAVSGLHCILNLYNEYQKDQPSYEKVKDMLERLISLRQTLGNADAKELFSLAKQIAAFLAAVITTKHVTSVVDVLLDKGLTDVVDDSANGACVVLNGLVHKNGGKFTEEEATNYTKLMVKLIATVSKHENCQTGLLHCLKTLAKHQCLTVTRALMTYEIPFEDNVVKSLHSICSELPLCKIVLDHLIDVMLNSQLFEDTGKDNRVKLCPNPYVACIIVGHVMELVTNNKQICEVVPANMTWAYLLLIGAAHEANQKDKDTKEKKTCVSHVIDSFKKYIDGYYGRHCNEWMKQNDLWTRIADFTKYDDAVADVIKFVVNEDVLSEEEKDLDPEDDVKPLEAKPMSCTPLVKAIYQFIQPYVNKQIPCHRLIASSIVSQLVLNCLGDRDLVNGSFNLLLTRSAPDEKEEIKLIALTGLSRIGVHPFDEISMFVAPIITTVLTCFSDENTSVVHKSMRTLNEILRAVDPGPHLASVVVPICMRLKPGFESADDNIRHESFKLFTILVDLTLAGKLDSTLMEQQMFLNLPAVLMHINDSEVSVRQPAKGTLHSITKYLAGLNKKSSFTSLMAKPQYAPDKKMDFDEFAREFSGVWVREFFQHVNDVLIAFNGFFKANPDQIKANAAIFAGYMLSHLDEDGLKRCNVEQTTSGLISLLKKESNKLVRGKAAKALGLYT
eukprot:NODE_51_length_4234_cov_36.088543_g42_i0.p1 GENE.NODE_51_length_4234_cov_36.088543_g42_i0~~NODE_51_length_4234_cov_36.088543_g42_i0.p1  ORF type:complete len:1373 (-),score=349.25 NODE_51_length_4234_cov_36.088543_g42_i0:114-3680(-)